MLSSLERYEHFVYDLPNRYPAVVRSTLVFVRYGLTVAEVRGQVEFEQEVVLVVAEAIDFAGQGRITQYGYEVWQGGRKIWWYDPQPHPDDPTLASTHPHHKHIHPEIKHNRIPAPGLSFEEPNLPFLIEEIEQELLHNGLERGSPDV
jgi:hypothetical protein